MKYLLGLATSLTLTMNGTNTLHASDLMAGIHPFLCNDESFVIVEDNDTWSIANSNLEVLATDNGWRFEDRDEGDVGYLTETRDDEWELNWLSSYGHEKMDCIDLFSATDQVVEIIKPKIDENISKTQKDFEHVKQKAADLLLALTKAETSIADLQEEISENEQAHLNKLAVVKGQVAFLTNAREREGKALKEAEKTIAVMEAEINALSYKLEGQIRARENLSYALDQKENDLRILNEKYKRLFYEPSGVTFLEQLQAMEPSERNKVMKESKFGGPALVRGGKLGRCIDSLRNKGMLSGECKKTLVDFLFDPNIK